MSGAVAKRYARALFEVASERGKIDQIETELKAVVEAIQQSADLSKIMLHPHISPEAKKDLANELFAAHVSEEVKNFLGVVIENGRESDFNNILAGYVQLANEARGFADAVVTSAKPLNDEEQAALAEKFGKMLNKKLRIQTVVDASILGGIIVQIGDRLYDGSIRTKLQHFAHQV